MSSSAPNAESDPFHTIIYPLLNLLDHKAHNTYPPPYPNGYTIISTFQLNRAIRKRIEVINARNLVDATGSDDLKQAFAQLEHLVKGWGYRGGREEADKMPLELTMRQLYDAIDSLGGEEKDGEEKDGEEKDGEEKDGEEKDGEEKDGEEKDGEEKVGKEKDEE